MDAALKQRMVGALVLIALAVIFIPMILEGPPADSVESMDLDIPPRESDRKTRVIPVDPDAAPNEATRPREEPVAATPPEASSELPREDDQVVPRVDATEAAVEVARTPDVEPIQDEPTEPVQSKPEPEPEPVEAQPVSQPATVATSSAPETPGSGWLVQVGSFRNQANALDLVARLKSAEFPARLETAGSATARMYRIRVGPYGSEADARDFRARIKRQFPSLTPSVLSDAQASGGRSETVQTWVVQAGSFGERANADSLRDRLRGGGYAAFVEPVGSSYRVRVGPELTRARADTVRDEIESKFSIRGIVVSYR